MATRVYFQNGIEVDELDIVYITGGGYIRHPFVGISRDSAWGWEEPVWNGELTRSTDFVLSNITDVEFGLVARCELVFKYMHSDDFIALRKIAKQRVCTVDYYNRDLGKRVTQEMAFTENELGKIYNYGSTIYGNTNVSVKLVATNRDRADIIDGTYSITFNANGGTINFDTSKFTNIGYTANIKLPSASEITHTTKALKYFSTNKDGTGAKYLPNQDITIFDNLILYAYWG